MRYEKQEIFIGREGQEKIIQASITIVGIGALGTNVLDILARAGAGKIKIIDRDVVELSNLHRQALFTENDVGKPKVYSAKEKINGINSDVIVESYLADLDYDNVDLLKSDLILDCTDNIYTRFLINEYAKKNNIPWIYSAVIGSKGMVMNITNESACLNCILKEPDEPLDTCDSLGVIGSIVKVIAGIQATEALKILTCNIYNKNLIRIDLWNNEIYFIKVDKRKECKVCNGIYEYINGNKKNNVIKICGSSNYQIKIYKNMDLIFEKLSNDYKIKNNEEFLVLENVVIFKSGRALIKAESLDGAKKILDGYLG